MDETIPLIIDSSVLKQVPKLNSELFKELVKYTRAGLYSLYISEIVEKEFISWIKAEAQSAFDTVAKATKSLNKYYDEPDVLGFDFKSHVTVLVAESQINEILKKVTDNWIAFKEKTDATVIPVQPEHGKLVMDAYFGGGKPFRSVKSRADIPDAFIYCSIKDLLEANEKVVFVSSDKKLIQAINCERVICFESLSKLFSEGPARLDARFFNSLGADNKFFTLVRIYEEEIHRKLVQEVEFTELDDILEAKFVESAVGEYKDISTHIVDAEKNYREARNISDLSFLVPFEANIMCTVQSRATKYQVETLEEKRLKKIEKGVDENGEIDVSEKGFFSVSGHFSLKFDDSDPSTWKEKKTSGLFSAQREIKEIAVVLEDIQENA